MKKLLLIRDIYYEGFKNLGHIIVKNYFKVFTWFCIALIFIAIYAFIYRVSTGFYF